MNVTERGLDLIKRFEGLVLSAYRDTRGILTIGYGTTAAAGVGIDPQLGMTITKEQAELYLALAARKFADRIGPAIKRAMTEGEEAALLSFAYNVGPGPSSGQRPAQVQRAATSWAPRTRCCFGAGEGRREGRQPRLVEAAQGRAGRFLGDRDGAYRFLDRRSRWRLWRLRGVSADALRLSLDVDEMLSLIRAPPDPCGRRLWLATAGVSFTGAITRAPRSQRPDTRPRCRRRSCDHEGSGGGLTRGIRAAGGTGRGGQTGTGA